MGGPGPSLWVRRAERVQPPGTGGRTGGEASCVSSLGGWRDGGRRGWEGTAPLQPVRSSRDAGPHPPGVQPHRAPHGAPLSSLLARCVCVPRWCVVSHEVCRCRCCPRVSSLLAARAPSAGALAPTLQSSGNNCTSVTTEHG